jgi:hypothetical protein
MRVVGSRKEIRKTCFSSHLVSISKDFLGGYRLPLTIETILNFFFCFFAVLRWVVESGQKVRFGILFCLP